MNNQDPKSRMQRYDFNTKNNKVPTYHRKGSHLHQIIIVSVIALILIISVGIVNQYSYVEDSKQKHSVGVSKNSNDKGKYNTTETNKKNISNNGKLDHTKKYKSSLPSTNQNREINQEEKTNTKNGKQSNPKSNNRNQNVQSDTNTSSYPSSQDTEATTRPNDNSISKGLNFSIPHTFSSVEDARNWVSATRSVWVKQGYTNYKITQDPQGNYVLVFTK